MAGQSGLLMEAYLIAADPNKERREARRLALERQCEQSDVSDLPAVKSRARELVNMQKHVFRGLRSSVSLANIASKVDLVASIRD